MVPPTPSAEPSLDLPPALRRAWGVPGVIGRRGRKASLTVERIVAEAVALADSEGIAGLSLIRVAERLGVTTNALYRYIDSRLELEVLLREYALADPPSGERSADWRADVRGWAYEVHGRYTRHPWLADLQTMVPLTPNALGWLEALLSALEPARLEATHTLRAASLVDGYVRERFATRRDLGFWNDVPDEPTVFAAVAERLVSHALPRVSGMFAAEIYREPPDGVDADFAFGVERIIAGLDQLSKETSA